MINHIALLIYANLVLIELRRDEMQRELRRDTTASGDEDEGQQSAGVKSSVVVKREQMEADKDDDNDTQSEDSGNEENGVEQDEHPIEAEQNNNAEKDMAEPEAEKVTEEESGMHLFTYIIMRCITNSALHNKML